MSLIKYNRCYLPAIGKYAINGMIKIKVGFISYKSKVKMLDELQYVIINPMLYGKNLFLLLEPEFSVRKSCHDRRTTMVNIKIEVYVSVKQKLLLYSKHVHY